MGTFLLTPIIDSIFDCVIQSRDVREDRALKQPEKLSPSPITCPDGNDYFEPCAQGFLGQFSRRRGQKKPPTDTSLKRLPIGIFLAGHFISLIGSISPSEKR